MDDLFFVLSKVLAAFLLLETWILLLLVGALLFLRVGRLHWARRLLTAGTGLLGLITLFPIGAPMLGALERVYPPNPPVLRVAGILVLGGGEDTRQSDLWGVPLVNEGGDRFLTALALAERFPEATVLFTGGIGSLRQAGPSGADIAEELLAGAGLSRERLLLERASRNTAENARLSLALQGDRTGPWVLVTSASHMPRAVASFCAAGWTDLVPWPTDYRSRPFLQGIEWDLSRNLRDLEGATREVVGLAVYRMTGRAVSPAPPGCLYRA